MQPGLLLFTERRDRELRKKGGGKVTVLAELAGREGVKERCKMCLLDHFPLL